MMLVAKTMMMPKYYINTEEFKTATSIYMDEDMNIIAPNGFYENNGSYRRQVDGGLLPIKECPLCVAK